MKISDISITRLATQHLSKTNFKNAQQVVAWMGAMQSQDYAMAKWAIGVRLPGSTEKVIEEAFNNGSIIRTHLLRPTWHFVSSDDIYWMLELTAPHIKKILKRRLKELELSPALLKKSISVIEKALEGNKHLTRRELMALLKKVRISGNDLRGAHIMLHAELEGIVCSGRIKDKQHSYALLQERVSKIKSINRDEALAKLALTYFTSHGPATLQDFRWWSGLPAADTHTALGLIKSKLKEVKVIGNTYWMSASKSPSVTSKNLLCLLPAYDEFIISYKDRIASMPHENQRKAISNNGFFRPLIVFNGQVEGIWKRIQNKEKDVIETQFFRPPGKSINKLLNPAVNAYGTFLNRKTEITFG